MASNVLLFDTFLKRIRAFLVICVFFWHEFTACRVHPQHNSIFSIFWFRHVTFKPNNTNRLRLDHQTSSSILSRCLSPWPLSAYFSVINSELHRNEHEVHGRGCCQMTTIRTVYYKGMSSDRGTSQAHSFTYRVTSLIAPIYLVRCGGEEILSRYQNLLMDSDVYWLNL